MIIHSIESIGYVCQFTETGNCQEKKSCAVRITECKGTGLPKGLVLCSSALGLVMATGLVGSLAALGSAFFSTLIGTRSVLNC